MRKLSGDALWFIFVLGVFLVIGLFTLAIKAAGLDAHHKAIEHGVVLIAVGWATVSYLREAK